MGAGDALGQGGQAEAHGEDKERGTHATTKKGGSRRVPTFAASPSRHIPMPFARTVRVTKRFTFEMAHALRCHDGQCAHIHGHSYVLDVTIAGFAVHPGGGLARRDLFHWWLCQAVPAAFMERLPDHIYSGDWPWPPAAP